MLRLLAFCKQKPPICSLLGLKVRNVPVLHTIEVVLNSSLRAPIGSLNSWYCLLHWWEVFGKLQLSGNISQSEKQREHRIDCTRIISRRIGWVEDCTTPGLVLPEVVKPENFAAWSEGKFCELRFKSVAGKSKHWKMDGGTKISSREEEIDL